jgi:hypothetical protein
MEEVIGSNPICSTIIIIMLNIDPSSQGDQLSFAISGVPELTDLGIRAQLEAEHERVFSRAYSWVDFKTQRFLNIFTLAGPLVPGMLHGREILMTSDASTVATQPPNEYSNFDMTVVSWLNPRLNFVREATMPSSEDLVAKTEAVKTVNPVTGKKTSITTYCREGRFIPASDSVASHILEALRATQPYNWMVD